MKTIVITGANSGIGFEASLQIAKLNHKVIMICRNEDRAKKACQKIIEESKNRNISYLIADLSNISDVDKTAETLLQNENVDVLINNAADFDLSSKTAKHNAHGIETQFATNVIAPFILSEKLISVLSRNKGKIINISSQGLCLYPNITLDFDNLNSEKSYKANKVYYQNKLALLMISLFMKDKYKDVDIHSVRVTNVKIDISRYNNISNFMKFLYKIKSKFSISPSEMAKVYTSLSEKNYSGFLYDEKCKEVKANKFAYNKNAQERLYNLLRDKFVDNCQKV